MSDAGRDFDRMVDEYLMAYREFLAEGTVVNHRIGGDYEIPEGVMDRWHEAERAMEDYFHARFGPRPDGEEYLDGSVRGQAVRTARYVVVRPFPDLGSDF